MKSLLMLMALATSACGPFCKTSTVGNISVFKPDQALCKEYDTRFETALQYLFTKNNPYLSAVLTRWERYSIAVRETPTWEVEYPEGTIRVAGMTDCLDYRMSVVGHAAEDKSALMHEMIHYIQNCQSGADDLDGHKYWKEQNIWNLIDDFNYSIRRPDDEQPLP